MKHLFLLSTLFFTTCFSQLVLATEKTETSEHFKYRVNINTGDQHGLYKIRIPQEIQSLLERQDGKDLQVFDANNAVVPTYVKYHGSTEPATEIVTPLDFFPITQEKLKQGIDSNSLKFSYTEGKIEMLVDDANTKTNKEAQQEIIGFILENPLMQENGINQILGKAYFKEIVIETDENFTGTAEFELRSSHDLNTWTTSSPSEKIVRMNYLGKELKKDHINIPVDSPRFIMLRWQGNTRPDIKSISAIVKKNANPPPYEWFEIKGLVKSTEENTKNSFEFKLSPALHSNTFRMNKLDSGDIYSGFIKPFRLEQSSYSGKHYPFVFYFIPNNDEDFKNLETNFSSQSSSFWKIAFDYPENDIDPDALGLEFNYQALDLYFLAKGAAPFHLEFGRKNGAVQPEKLEQTIHSLVKDTDILASEAKIDGSIREIIVEEVKKIHWKKILLWSVLIFGVLLMLFMAKDLFKKLNANQAE